MNVKENMYDKEHINVKENMDVKENMNTGEHMNEEHMDAREYLMETRQLRARLEGLLERRKWWEEMSDGHSGGTSQPLAQLRRELDARIDAVAARELEAMGRIDALPDAGQREVLRCRYLNGWRWREIAAHMNLSQDWVKHIHVRALRAMDLLRNDVV